MTIPPIPDPATAAPVVATVSQAQLIAALQSVGIEGDDLVRVGIDATKILVERCDVDGVQSVQVYILDTTPVSAGPAAATGPALRGPTSPTRTATSLLAKKRS